MLSSGRRICLKTASFMHLGCFSFLCDFHTEQAWKRWVGPAIGVKDADEVLTMLRSIANSPDEATYNETEGVLKSSSHWLDNKSLQEWFGHFWLNESKRWVTYHRQVLVGKLINTTNGLERQHRHFKEGYLGYYTEGSLTSMVSTLVTKYVPAVCRSAFLNERVRRGLETSQPQSWTMESVPHAKQFDSISCGVYLIQRQGSMITGVGQVRIVIPTQDPKC
ncbi:uncharacterized protein LOC127872742 isoform X4 [Dreissena polymorpha]|uniref:uncharacterized protein LOC127872742 isoform X4 n=1 Tax=Dreissena polymorpha TaxID=45954 RepID=UPI00226497D2|nr:uncharacterized protein LOC127872742 isoform X4 [Dreissena polymorpha]